MEMITLQKGGETKQVSRMQWENMKAGNTFGWTEVIETPLELLAHQAIKESIAAANTGTQDANQDANNSSKGDDQKQSLDAQIAALEEQKKQEGLTPQQKANITKQIKELQAQKEAE